MAVEGIGCRVDGFVTEWCDPFAPRGGYAVADGDVARDIELHRVELFVRAVERRWGAGKQGNAVVIEHAIGMDASGIATVHPFNASAKIPEVAALQRLVDVYVNLV